MKLNPNDIQSSQELRLFINELIQDHKLNLSDWENEGIEGLLSGMEAGLADHEKAHPYPKPITNETNPWQAIASALMLGKIYE